MKNLRGWGLVGVVLLAGCGSDEEASDKRHSGEVGPRAVTQQEHRDAATAIERVDEPLEVSFTTTAALGSDRRLRVEGESNLPDGTRIQLVVEREVSRVRWQSRTEVREGAFSAGPFGPGSGLPDGGYIIRVQLSEARTQPASVQTRIGQNGENLTGALVTQSRHGLGQVAQYSRRFLIGNEPRRTLDQVEVLERPGSE